MSLLLKYATRNRPKLFLETLENITNTISTKEYQILVSLDKDDSATLASEVLEKAYQFPNVKIKIGEPISKVAAINRDFEHANPWTWCVTMSDDIKFIQSGWDGKMLNDIRGEWGNSTDFFAHFPDGFVNEAIPTLNVCGYDYFMRDKFTYHPVYYSVSCDVEAMYTAQMRGRYKYFPTIYYNHIHPGNISGMPNDETYRKNNPLGEIDTATYFERMSYGFYVENPVFMPEEVKFYMNKRLNTQK